MEPPPAAQVPVRYRTRDRVAIAILVTVIAPFTALAWPFALITGLVIGRAQVGRLQGETPSIAERAIRVLAVTGGVVGMMVFGLILGGLVSFLIAALAPLSVQRAAGGTPRQKAGATLLLVTLPTLVWLLVFSGPPGPLTLVRRGGFSRAVAQRGFPRRRSSQAGRARRTSLRPPPLWRP